MERTNLRSIWLLWAGKDDPGMIAAISETTRAIKQSICANRLALFSPFYVADYGSNHCKRRRMSDREILGAGRYWGCQKGKNSHAGPSIRRRLLL